jgi:hypothetical protein
MEAFTAHASDVCLTDDDLEAINTLYPVVSGAILTPRCHKVPLYLGSMRLTGCLLLPALVSLLVAAIAHSIANALTATHVHAREHPEEAALAHSATRQRHRSRPAARRIAGANEVYIT